MTRIEWSEPVHELFLDLPQRDQNLIAERLIYVRLFPYMYPVRNKGRFRRHRWFMAGNWLVYYRVVGDTAYIRGIWPARIP